MTTSAQDEPLLPQPADSKIVLADDGTEVTLVIPSTGFRRYHATVFFALLWIAATIGFGIPALLATPHNHDPAAISLPAASLFLGGFFAAGVIILLVVWQVARRRAVLVVTRESLTFSQVGPVRSTERQIAREAITAVRVDNSNVSVNDVPLKNLQIHQRDVTHLGLFTGRDESELRWLASVLRHALAVPER